MKPTCYFIQPDQLQLILENLTKTGYECIGPQVRDAAIVYDHISSIEQLPRGVNDQQAAGSYLLIMDSSQKFFNWANGPQAIKPWLFKPRQELWHSEQTVDGHISFKSAESELKPLAIIGVRACDLAALQIQDQHFLQQQFVDTYYKAQRQKLFLIAVNCGHPADTCFCHSTGDGPFVDDGADIILTELDAGFLCEAHSPQGEKILSGLNLSYKTEDHTEESAEIKSHAEKQKKQLPKIDIKAQLFKQLDNEAWHTIAGQCLSCGNCTLVCPTCFCHSEHDDAQLDGRTSSHYREWDSCFNKGHSYIHGITIRSETSQRYRQWLTHKFSSWYEQYGRSGCVGCGRCISWCPVAIDVTESVKKIVERRHD